VAGTDKQFCNLSIDVIDPWWLGNVVLGMALHGADCSEVGYLIGNSFQGSYSVGYSIKKSVFD
jgi:hypothetical protein